MRSRGGIDQRVVGERAVRQQPTPVRQAANHRRSDNPADRIDGESHAAVSRLADLFDEPFRVVGRCIKDDDLVSPDPFELFHL